RLGVFRSFWWLRENRARLMTKTVAAVMAATTRARCMPHIVRPKGETGMRLDGIHHVTCITGDAQQNVDFYTGVMGLRLVAKSVNQDDPTVYHLFYSDELGRPGSDITFFEYPGAAPGEDGAGMIHRIVWRVASAEAVDFWEQRLRTAGVATER